MKKKTKVGVAMLILTIIFVTIFMVVQTYATDSKFLNITGTREGNEVYKITSIDPQKTIWKIVSYDSMLETATASYDEAIYCINPEIGFGSEQTSGNDRKEYDVSFNMKDLTSVEQKYKDMFTDKTKYNSMLWILDNCYLPKQTPEADKQAVKQTLYTVAGIERDVLTDNDIEVVQQLALWYFSTENAKYHYEPDNFPSIAINETAIEEIGMPLTTEGQQRINDMKKLYSYFITSAKEKASNYGTGDIRELKAPKLVFNSPAKNTITSIETINGEEYFVAGPYNIEEKNHTVLPYAFTATVLNQTNESITDYKLLNQTKTIMDSNEIDKTLLKQDFYIAVPTTNKAITKIKLNIKADYITTKATCWTHSENYATEQPVVIIEKDPHELIIEEEVEVRRPEFDLALRKFITQVNETEITTRVPQVDVSKLIDGSATTATYTHTKDPVTVKKGDIVIYTIRVYNEGELNGYAKEITDNIPKGLKFLVNNATNIEYMWRLSENGDKITTNYLSREKDDNNELIAFNPNTMTTLHYKDVKVAFEVIEPNTSDEIITNIAEISEDTDSDGNEITDIDSEPDNGVTNEDDIDQEHLKLEYFDLALRKFITKVNEKEITTRVPQVDVSKLVDGSATTATYTHTKDPLGVRNGDKIVYTIRVYNEGKIDGYAEEITDYIPEGLKFVSAENSTINNTYGWVVSEDGKTITTNYLSRTVIKAFDKTTQTQTPTLSYKDVQVEFEVTEPNTSDRVLRNIAEITKDSNDDVDSTPKNADINNYNPPEDNSSYQEDDDDYEQINLKYFDLALRKFVTKVNEREITTRVPQVDVSKLVDGSSTTATYTHTKDPLGVRNGDKIVYTIRVYNEGKIDGYAEEITDYIPEGLKFISAENSTINAEYGWVVSEDGKTITTNYLSRTVIKAFDVTTQTPTLSYKDVQVEFEVTEPNTSERVLRNIAEITKDSNDDIDSTPKNADINNYNPPEDNSSYQEDDDDYEQIKLKYFDLALRKFITKVNSEEITTRVPQVDVSKLVDGSSTTATYTHTKEPLGVQKGDKIVYTIRVYNEGKIDGYAEEITDYIPEGLKFISAENSTINAEYGWVVSEDGKTITTNYLSKAKSTGNVIKAFDVTTQKLSYKDVQVEFEVIEPNTSERVLRNIAEITKDSNDDVDSTPKNADINNYNPPADNSSYQEDDDDYEQIKLEYFDLALRKFITKVNSKEITTRVPQVTLGKDGELVYTHTKEPLIVANKDIVVYTIRVYNEGKTAGYAKEVSDDIPQGLTYLPEHEINKKYEWKISDDKKTVSTDYLSKEKSEEREEDNLLQPFNKSEGISNEEGKLNPDYRDVKIAFKVTENNLPSDRIIINTAEITDDSDSDGNDITDEDSVPNNNKEGEDDIDQEFVKVQYFDLSLLKWVSKVYITEGGKTTIRETGHTGLEDPEPIVKVDLDRKNINKVTVKFGYVIKITNEGEIAGYAKEISDYIPEGLKFVKEDNPDWEETEGKIVTKKLEDTLLQPGESATVEVILTWINDSNNVGLKTNIAEISEDYNEKDAKDIDSTPNNKKDGEDDIDDAPVLLTIRTGSEPTYTILGIVILAILAGGIILIKKYVLD